MESIFLPELDNFIFESAEHLKKDPTAVIQCVRRKDEVSAYSAFVK
jgi:hypothetical protein